MLEIKRHTHIGIKSPDPRPICRDQVRVMEARRMRMVHASKEPSADKTKASVLAVLGVSGSWELDNDQLVAMVARDTVYDVPHER